MYNFGNGSKTNSDAWTTMGMPPLAQAVRRLWAGGMPGFSSPAPTKLLSNPPSVLVDNKLEGFLRVVLLTHATLLVLYTGLALVNC